MPCNPAICPEPVGATLLFPRPAFPSPPRWAPGTVALPGFPAYSSCLWSPGFARVLPPFCSPPSHHTSFTWTAPASSDVNPRLLSGETFPHPVPSLIALLELCSVLSRRCLSLGSLVHRVTSGRVSASLSKLSAPFGFVTVVSPV